MKVSKKQLLFDPSSKFYFAVHSALQPTPLKTGDNTARIFFGARDSQGVSRIAFVDVIKSGDDLRVSSICKQPVLDIGLPGTFDDNGVVPCAVVKSGDKILLYYAGYQLPANVKFLVFGGLAISTDGGETFKRFKNTPVLERTHDEFLFRVAHSLLYEEGKWRVWYGAGNRFERINERSLPVYDIRYMESQDGIHFPNEGQVVIGLEKNEYRVGRPFVFKRNEKYIMFFGASSFESAYRLTYATSDDGYVWQRQNDLEINYSDSEFDSEMSAYPCIVELEGKTFLIYNGNEYGKHGLGYAQLEF